MSEHAKETGSDKGLEKQEVEEEEEEELEKAATAATSQAAA